MPASTSVQVQDAVMRLRATHHSIVMVNSGPTALAWLLAGYASQNHEIYCFASSRGFEIDCGPAQDVSFGVRVQPGEETIRHIAKHVNRWLTNLDPATALGMVVDDVITLGDGRVLEGWRAESKINDRGHLVLTVTPAFV